MGSVVVVVVFPLLQFVVKSLGIIDDNTVKKAIELFGVDAMRAFNFAVESRCGGFDVDVVDALSRTCQWKADWNSAPLSVWMTSTPKGSRPKT